MKISTAMILGADPSAQLFCAVQEFDYVDVLSFSTKPDISSRENVLFCVTESSTEDDESWYGTMFDRRKCIGSLPPGQTILTEKFVPGVESQIVVANVYECLRKLNAFVLGEISPVVIGVTGSVGKTTCVCMLEDVFSQYGLTLRIYTKRITPLSLFEIVINQLTPEHKFVVMEYSMYFRHHIKVLTELLPPSVGIMLNIDNAHINIDGIKTPDDIWNAKKSLLEAAQCRIVERGCLSQLSQDVELMPSLNIFKWQTYTTVNVGHEGPFIQSRLAFTQIGAVLIALIFVNGGLTDKDVKTAFSSKPKENRLSRITLESGITAFFDGEVTTSFRLYALGDTLYPVKTLILMDVEFYDQPLHNQEEQFAAATQLFDRVYIFNDLKPEFTQFVLRNSPGATLFTDYSAIEPLGEVFIHWGAYWRSFSEPPAL